MSRSNPRVLSTLERAGGFASAQEVYQLDAARRPKHWFNYGLSLFTEFSK